MFNFPTTGFWCKKELAYQHVHAWWGFVAGLIASYFLAAWWVPMATGLLLGLCVELYQHVQAEIREEPLPYVLDSIRNIIFWTAGGCFNLSFRPLLDIDSSISFHFSFTRVANISSKLFSSMWVINLLLLYSFPSHSTFTFPPSLPCGVRRS